MVISTHYTPILPLVTLEGVIMWIDDGTGTKILHLSKSNDFCLCQLVFDLCTSTFQTWLFLGGLVISCLLNCAQKETETVAGIIIPVACKG
jgi:hypothetical protein